MVAGTYQFSNSTSFGTNLTIPEICEDAYMRAGMIKNDTMDQASYRFAVRALNLCFANLDSLGATSWAHVLTSTTPVQGQQTFNLNQNVVDIDQMIVTPTNGSDILITRLSQDQWIALPNKTQQGMPTNYFINRTIPQSVVYLWPTPDATGYTISWFQTVQLQDINGGGDENVYIPVRAAEMVISDLAWRLAVRVEPERVQMLQTQAEQALFNFIKGDSNKVPLSLSIDGYFSIG